MIKVSTLAECMAEGRSPEILFWVGCAGSFDERAKKITKAFVKILHNAGVDFAVLGLKKVVVVTRQNGPEMSFFFKCKP